MKIVLKGTSHHSSPVSRYDLDGEYLQTMELPVIAIMRNWGTLSYLARFSVPGTPQAIEWLDADAFDVTDETIPQDWVEMHWPAGRPFRLSNSQFDFDFRITYFHGSISIIESEDFLFHVVEDPEKACVALSGMVSPAPSSD